MIDHRQENDSEACLHLSVLVQLVDDHFRKLILFQPKRNTHTITVRFVPDILNPFYLLVLDEVCDLFDQPGLIDLIGQLRNDDSFPLGAFILFNQDTGPYPDDPATFFVRFTDPVGTVNQTGRRKIRPREDLHQFLAGKIGVIDQRMDGIDHFLQVVWGDIRCHSNGYAG